MRALVALGFAVVLGCGGGQGARTGGIDDVVVVTRGGPDRLPFNPRGSRITMVAAEIQRVIGHPLVFELDTALSPELVSSLESTVLASFETVARELVNLQKHDPGAFAKARTVTRIVCTYDAVAKYSDGKLDGTVLRVKSPPDRYPLLERGVFSELVARADEDALDARWGDVDPAKLAPRDRRPYFEYMMMTRPGYGYLWSHRRARAGSRLAHIGRIVTLARFTSDDADLDRRVMEFLTRSDVVGFMGHEPASPTKSAYQQWILQANLDEKGRLEISRTMFPGRYEVGASFPEIDAFAFVFASYDAWRKAGEPETPFSKELICPSKPFFEEATELHFSCGRLASALLSVGKDRERLAEVVGRRKDKRLLELVLLNYGGGNSAAVNAVKFLESLADEELFQHGFRVLFFDHHRESDVNYALKDAAGRWWHDAPNRRPQALLVIARQNASLHPHYSESAWSRFPPEYGGLLPAELFERFLAQGWYAAHLAPNMWPVIERSPRRDQLIAQALPGLLEHGKDAQADLALLRDRFCKERNASGLAQSRASIAGWVRTHPAGAADVSNALHDFELARCPKPSSSAER